MRAMFEGEMLGARGGRARDCGADDESADGTVKECVLRIMNPSRWVRNSE